MVDLQTIIVLGFMVYIIYLDVYELYPEDEIVFIDGRWGFTLYISSLVFLKSSNCLILQMKKNAYDGFLEYVTNAHVCWFINMEHLLGLEIFPPRRLQLKRLAILMHDGLHSYLYNIAIKHGALIIVVVTLHR